MRFRRPMRKRFGKRPMRRRGRAGKRSLRPLRVGYRF